MIHINVNEVKEIIGTYKSQLYKNYYAVEVLVNRDGLLFKIQYPYNTMDKVNKAMTAIQNKKQQELQQPDYSPLVFIQRQKQGRKR